MNPTRAALRNREVVLVLAAFAVVLGLRALLTMPRREDPKITIRTGLVVAQYPGATAEQVEMQVTRKIEQRLFRHDEVRKRKTYSTSRDGIVVVNVELEERIKDPDRFWAMLRHDMNELKATELPPTVRGPIVNANFGDVAAVLLAVRGPRYTSRELRAYLDRVEDAIRTIPEVSRINRFGEQREELRVTTSNARLAQLGITPNQIAGAIRARNAVKDAGTLDAGPADRVPLRTVSLFDEASDLKRLLVGSARDGRPAYLGDFVQVERRFEDPSYLVRVNGADAVVLSVEMQEGHNIVHFGKEVRAKVAEVRRELPADLRIEAIADQPVNVARRMTEFGREFLITLAAVILVTVLLLPLRIAAVAAVAIPVTVTITAAILAAVGIELHQVTFAGLVVALGIVVDDAIVVADNYVEKLDHGITPFEAAWRAPSELAVPVLAATLTIVASFLPIAYLPGAPGEFIRAMSFTVAIALMVSFVVAMLLTPLLALLFVKTGLHTPTTASTADDGGGLRELIRRVRPLDAMQSAYERVMSRAMPHRRTTLFGAVFAFVAGIALFTAVPYRFFPLNERDQFIIDVWLPAGTRVEGTNAVMRRLEAELRRTAGVRTVATFVGAGAPRFYYNLSPEPPSPNYGEFVVTAESPDQTMRIVRLLSKRLDRVAPEAWVYVKPLQQGPVIPAPIEVRLVGDDPQTLRIWGDSVARIFERTPGSAYVHTDWRDEELGLAIHLRHEVATRLGITDGDVASQLAIAFSGAPISTFWEGKRDLDITFRLDSAERTRLDDVGSTYLVAPATGARVLLREVADVASEWRPSRIVRRNGVRTLTVRSFTAPGLLPSVVLKAARPKLDALTLPEGVRLEQGGELEGSADVQGAVNIALLISMIGVFMILLLQFRNARQPLVVMVSIPLALVGAALGLVITGNPFTYTANLGLNALTGIVVRNAIILVDYANELRRTGVDVETAALLAGRRRLRPIFLTTMAAALGVTPMILSRSPLWSPMASVIAVGLLVSMMFTLVVVPTLYVVVERRVERRTGRAFTRELIRVPAGDGAFAGGRLAAATRAISVVALLAATIGSPLRLKAQVAGPQITTDSTPTGVAPRVLTLDEAIDLALERSTATRIAAARLEGAAAHRRGVAADYLPRLALTGNRIQGSGGTTITIPQGVLGNDGTGAPVPADDRRFRQGTTSLTLAQLSLSQPVTQLYRIRQANALAAAQVKEAEAARALAAREIALGVDRLYVAALIAREKAHAMEVALVARRRQLVDAEGRLAAGTMIRPAVDGVRADALEAAYSLVAARNEVDDVDTELRDLLDLPANTQLMLATPVTDTEALRPLAEYISLVLTNSPEVAAAMAQEQQAKRAIALSSADYIPDVGIGVTYTYLNGVAFLPEHSAAFTIQGSWTAWDFGKRGAAKRERQADARAASLALDHARDRAIVDVEKAYRKAERSARAAAAASAALEARGGAAAVARDEHARGIVAVAYRADADAALALAKARTVEAELGAQLARDELTYAAGIGRVWRNHEQR